MAKELITICKFLCIDNCVLWTNYLPYYYHMWFKSFSNVVHDVKSDMEYEILSVTIPETSSCIPENFYINNKTIQTFPEDNRSDSRQV